MSEAGKARLSDEDHIAIPGGLSRRRGWHSGLEFEIEEREDGIVLRPMTRPFAPATLDQVAGCLPHEGPAISLAEMDDAVRREARKRGR